MYPNCTESAEFIPRTFALDCLDSMRPRKMGNWAKLEETERTSTVALAVFSLID